MKIFLTGDDGVNSVGFNLLLKLLSKNHDVFAIVTKAQQSGVGGYMTLKSKLTFTRQKIGNADVVIVDGSPSDGINAVRAFTKEKFDLIISGVNSGENISSAIISSGTFSAAVRAIGNDIADKAIVFSMKTNWKKYFIDHESTPDIEHLIDYPGKKILELIDLVIKKEFYGKNIVNINLPDKPTSEIKITKIDKKWSNYYYNDLYIEDDEIIFKFDKYYAENQNYDVNYDTGALNSGFISITPIDFI